MSVHTELVVRAVLIVALLLSIGYGVFELRRWQRPATRDLINPRQRTLRAWGLAFLLLTLTLFLVGTFLPLPHTKRTVLHSLVFWTITTLCAVPLIPLALLDARENLRRLMEGRAELAQQRVQIARDYLHTSPLQEAPPARDDTPTD